EKPNILNFGDIEIRAKDFQILGPEVGLGIDRLSLQASRGPKLKNLSADFHYSRERMRFDSLAIETDQSKLRGNLVFNYQREDLADFLNKVQVDAEFVESTVAFNEINAFFDEFGRDKLVTFSA